MVYKRIFCRTNHSGSVCNGVRPCVGLIATCQVSFAVTWRNHAPVESFPSRSPSLRLPLAFFTLALLLCHLSVVFAFPTSVPAKPSLQSDNSSTEANVDPNRNRLYRQAENTSIPPRLIVGFKLEGDAKSIIDNGIQYTIKANTEVTIRIFAIDFVALNIDDFLIGFSDEAPTEDGACHVRGQTVTNVTVQNKHIAVGTINLSYDQDELPYYLCYARPMNGNAKSSVYYYAGTNDEEWFKIKSEAPFVPIWVQIILIVLLLTMSGLFSGLNLGLMALDKNELQVIERCGTEQEKFWSRSISPVRKKGNYLLCTLLLGNVLVNSTLTIFMDELTSGIFAVISSTLAIVVFGEIIPQALCSRHGLAVGAKTIYITYLFMGLTFPLSFPISLLLDKILGEEIGNVYDRERLMEYIRVTKDYNRLEADEMNIISGALKFKNIRVADVMTPIDDVFMLPYTTTLNFNTLTLINNSGYSRIPVFENERDNVVGILHVKDLSLIDTDHNLPLKVVLDFYSHPLFSVFEDVTLDVMLNEFKKGKSHMALVRRVIDNGVTDPFYELLGVVTLEDIIEELIQAEINDETDVITDNRRKQKRKEVQSRPNYLDFIRHGFQKDSTDLYNCDFVISPQLALATFRFLASSIEPFRPDYLSEEVLKMLMRKNVYFEAKGQARMANICEMSPENVLYIRGEPADYFIMILEGRARVIVTAENQEYDAGPFCVFGIKALASATSALSNSFDGKADEKPIQSEDVTAENSPNVASSPLIAVDSTGSKSSTHPTKESFFTPDFTLFCEDRVVYMKVSRRIYFSAVMTTQIGKQRTSSFTTSISGMGNNEASFVDTRSSNDSQSVVPRERKVSQYLLDTQKFRKISLSTNLPDSTLNPDSGKLQSSNSGSDEKLVVSLSSQKKSDENELHALSAPSDNSKQNTAAPTEMTLKRSDAVDLLMNASEKTSPEDMGHIRMISLSRDNEPPKEGNGQANTKAGNGSLKGVTSKANSQDQKTTDLDDHDETSHLI